jgi:hypothetical protein
MTITQGRKPDVDKTGTSIHRALRLLKMMIEENSYWSCWTVLNGTK